MKKKRIIIKSFFALEISLYLLFLGVFMKLIQLTINIYNTNKINYINQSRMLVLKKYLCFYIKKYKMLPTLKNNILNINMKIPLIYQQNTKNIFYKIYLANYKNNEILYIVNEDNPLKKIYIYSHDIDIFTQDELELLFHPKESPIIVLINNQKKK